MPGRLTRESGSQHWTESEYPQSRLHLSAASSVNVVAAEERRMRGGQPPENVTCPTLGRWPGLLRRWTRW